MSEAATGPAGTPDHGLITCRCFLPTYQKRFLCDAGALEFLSGNKFDFNKFVYEGVPFMPLSLRCVWC